MIIEPLGDAAYILRDLPCPAHVLADALFESRIPGLLDASSSYETVGVYGQVTEEQIRDALSNLNLQAQTEPARHEIPVCYALGEDHEKVARHLSVTVQQLIEFHTSSEYECFAVGFCPGFTYLGWLPKELQGIPRMQSPRTRTEPGSVGITGMQTGVYPLARPGGWPIIGRTPLTLVDVDDNYFPIRAGDVVTFRQIDQEEFEKLKGRRL